MKIYENILISSLTTMRLGGPAKFVIEIEKPEDVPEAYSFANIRSLPIFVLGSGANTIGKDNGFPGVIIINRMQGVSLNGTTMRAMGGETWDNLVELACQNNLSGIEAMSKIPGTAGAAPVQNIGAYGQDISQTLQNIEVFDSYTLQFKTLTKDDLQFSYRKSILNTSARGRYFVIAITLNLSTASTMQRPYYTSLEKYIDEHKETDFSPASIRRMVSAIRAEKLPDPTQIASAGSFFKNVYLSNEEAERAEEKGIQVYRGNGENKINSGWLIEHAGLAGKVLHGIKVSEKAALVLINESAQSYNDLAAAREEIIGKIYDEYGFWLEQEPVEIPS